MGMLFQTNQASRVTGADVTSELLTPMLQDSVSVRENHRSIV